MVWLDSTFLLSVALLLYVGWVDRAGPWSGRLMLLLLLSPGLRYVSTLFTFPIRLCLSNWAGVLLRGVGMDVRVAGNVLITAGPSGSPIEMAVDPACMGLQLTGVSLLVALFFMIWQEQAQRKVVAPMGLVAYGLLTFGLVVGCNLVRILMLVALNAMPDTWAHELIGLICIAGYAWLPAWLLARKFVGRLGQAVPERQVRSGLRPQLVWQLVLLVVGLGVLAFTSHPRAASVPAAQLSSIAHQYGITAPTKPLANGFMQLSRPGLLIYVKPQTDWFSADHNPMTCWRGSGYALRYVRETTLDGHPAYVGELHRQGRTLYTAWWFSNGRTATLSQVRMRGGLLRGEANFSLINVTATRREALGQLARF